MLGTVLDKITSLVGRAFVISAFFPILLFSAALLGALTSIRTVNEIQAWWKQLEGLQALVSVIFFLVIIASAFLLVAISPVFKRILEGAYRFWFIGSIQLKWRQRRFLRKRLAVDKMRDELTLIQSKSKEFIGKLQKAYRGRSKQLGTLSEKGRGVLEGVERAIKRFQKAGGQPRLQLLVWASEDIEDLYLLYYPVEEETHNQVVRLQQRVAQIWNDLEKAAETKHSEELSDLQLRYAYNEGIAGVRPTALGHIMAALWSYPYTRYGIDATLMWPDLQKVIPADYLKVIEDARISYDFCVNMTFLSVLYAVISTALLWDSLRQRSWIPVLGLIFWYIFYRAAIEAARAFGSFFRSCFDLFRFLLIQELRIKLPADIKAERETWKDVNRILIFGDDKIDLNYVHTPQPEAEPAPASRPEGFFYW